MKDRTMKFKVTSNHTGTGKDKVKRDEPKSSNFDYEVTDSIASAIDTYGENVVYDLYVGKAIVVAQNVARNMMDNGDTDEEIQTVLDGFKLGDTRKSQPSVESSKESLKKYLAKLPKAQRAKVMAELMGEEPVGEELEEEEDLEDEEEEDDE